MSTMTSTRLTRTIKRCFPAASEKAVNFMANVVRASVIMSFTIPLHAALDANADGRNAEAIAYCALTAIWMMATIGLRGAIGFLTLLGGMAGFDRVELLYHRNAEMTAAYQALYGLSAENYDYSVIAELVLCAAISASMMLIGFLMIQRSIQRTVKKHSVDNPDTEAAEDGPKTGTTTTSIDAPAEVAETTTRNGKGWSDELGTHSWR